jgi:urease accessory protein UreF
MDSSSSDWWVALLLSDSVFPGGTLANSQGLESAVMHGVVSKDHLEQLLSFIRLALEQVWSKDVVYEGCTPYNMTSSLGVMRAGVVLHAAFRAHELCRRSLRS